MTVSGVHDLKVGTGRSVPDGMEISAEDYERLMHRSRLMDLAQDILIVTFPNGVIYDVNDAAARLHGCAVEDLLGRNVAEFLGADSAAEMLRVSTAMVERAEDCTDAMNLTTVRHDGSEVHIELRVSWSQSDRKFYVVERDVTERRQQLNQLMVMAEDLRRQARSDPLTGIANRAVFDEAMAIIEDTDDHAWLILIDVDYFKAINDDFGHMVGDDVLIEIAKRLQSVVQADELVARLGGDEFAIVMHNADHFTFQRRFDEVASRINDQYVLNEWVSLSVVCSLGAARRRDGDTTANWMRRADRHLYAAKDTRPHAA